MNQYTTYRIGTGQILRRGVTPFDDLEIVVTETPDEAVLAGHFDPATQWYDEGAAAIASRPVATATLNRGQIIADGVDEATISGVPDGATITIRTSLERESLTMDASETLVLTSVDPDTLHVKIRNWPDQDAEFQIQAFIGTRVDVPVGALDVAGLAPTVTADAAVAPAAGSVVVTGHAPGLAPEPATASLELTGLAPQVTADSASEPAGGGLEITGHAPGVSTS